MECRRFCKLCNLNSNNKPELSCESTEFVGASLWKMMMQKHLFSFATRVHIADLAIMHDTVKFSVVNNPYLSLELSSVVHRCQSEINDHLDSQRLPFLNVILNDNHAYFSDFQVQSMDVSLKYVIICQGWTTHSVPSPFFHAYYPCAHYRPCEYMQSLPLVRALAILQMILIPETAQ
jgi:hypothetical protein